MHFTNFCAPVYSIYPLATILKKSVYLKFKQRTKAGSNMAARPWLVESESWSIQPCRLYLCWKTPTPTKCYLAPHLNNRKEIQLIQKSERNKYGSKLHCTIRKAVFLVPLGLVWSG